MSAMRISVPGRLEFIDLGPSVVEGGRYLHGSLVVGEPGNGTVVERVGRTPEAQKAHPSDRKAVAQAYREVVQP